MLTDGWKTENGRCTGCNDSLESQKVKVHGGRLYAGHNPWIDQYRSVPCQKCFPELNESVRAEIEAECERERVKGEVAEAGIGLRFRRCTLENFEVGSDPEKARVLSICRSFVEKWPQVEERGSWLTFTGKPGTGKGHLACAILRAVIERYRVRVRFTKAADFLRAVKATWGKHSAEGAEERVMEEYASARLLVVDDLGSNSNSDNDRALLFGLFDARYERLRPTILTSNLRPDQLAEAVDERLVDRLKDKTSGNAVLGFNWPSYRSGE